jgi:8-oxo-dGTP diphosphatase
MFDPIEKVLVYLIRNRDNISELLVFEHLDFPEAGIQVPAGTIKKGEGSEAAAMRELKEETGLATIKIEKFLGSFEYLHLHRNETHMRNVLLASTEDKSIPALWVHTIEGDGEDSELRIKCYWVPVSNAKSLLVVGQGDYLDLLE